jgi:exosortase D (VPLPA-CTERM-specific)
VLLIFAGVVLNFAGNLATIYALTEYGLIITALGLMTVLQRALLLGRFTIGAILFFLSLPLPRFIDAQIFAHLQGLAGKLSARMLDVFGISVVLESNILDLGWIQTPVTDAYSDLFYLLPLVGISLAFALFRLRGWFSRIALVTVTPFILFIVSSAKWIGLAWLADQFQPNFALLALQQVFPSGSLFATFVVMVVFSEFLRRWTGRTIVAESVSRGGSETARHDVADAVAKTQGRISVCAATIGPAIIWLSVFGAAYRTDYAQVEPTRTSLQYFPSTVGRWHGMADRMDPAMLSALNLTDYYIANYQRSDSEPPVNLYIAYYATQRKGAAVHSPGGCLPGSGWETEVASVKKLKEVSPNSVAIGVNRVVMALGGTKILVYYFFPQRGRIITNEFLVKFYVLWDSLWRNRSDGGLVRLFTPIEDGGPTNAADERLVNLLSQIYPQLNHYIPN